MTTYNLTLELTSDNYSELWHVRNLNLKVKLNDLFNKNAGESKVIEMCRSECQNDTYCYHKRSHNHIVTSVWNLNSF